MARKSNITSQQLRERATELIEEEHIIVKKCAEYLKRPFEEIKYTNMLFEQVVDALKNGIPTKNEPEAVENEKF